MIDFNDSHAFATIEDPLLAVIREADERAKRRKENADEERAEELLSLVMRDMRAGDDFYEWIATSGLEALIASVAKRDGGLEMIGSGHDLLMTWARRFVALEAK